MKNEAYSNIKSDFLHSFYEFNRVQAKHSNSFSIESAYAYAFEEVSSGIESPEEELMLNLVISILIYNVNRSAFIFHFQELKRIENVVDLDGIVISLKEDAYYFKSDLDIVNELTS